MADSAFSADSLDRYGAIERAYCDEHWPIVIQDGRTLLEALERDAEAPEGLKERLQLLMGHAYFYGFSDRDSAEDFYQAVLRSGCESSLRQIAEQGLQLCSQPLPASSSVPVEEPQPVRQPAAAVVTPPVSPLPEPAEPSPAPESDLAWLQTQAPPAASPDAPAPVMPWLAGGPAPAVEAVATPSGERPFQSASVDAAAPVTPPFQEEHPAPGAEEPLVPELVDEPELIEVHQADPRLAEDLELSVRESLPPGVDASQPPQGERSSLSGKLEQPARVTSLAEGGSPAAAPDVVAKTSLAKTASVEVEPLPPSSPGVRNVVAPTKGLFSAPPEPVTEEDPELLLGLLRVEMG
ncbi:MAG: hypothetical protein ACKO0M_13830 [Cyanobium sp.]